MLSERERRALFAAYVADMDFWAVLWECAGCPAPADAPGVFRWKPAYTTECSGLTCGARTKSAGTPCKRRDIWRGGRCKLHGGHSTGPTTAAGKARAALNGRRPKRRTPQ